MAVDIEQIKNHYSKMADSRLERIAKFEITSLQPEVQPIVIAEIEKRGLDKNLLSGIDAQKKELTEYEVYELVDKIKRLDCPICAKSNQELLGGKIRKVRSFLIMTHYETRPIIACKTCVKKERKNQLIKNSILGWWGFPSGLLYRTPQAIMGHFSDNGKEKEISESILIEFAIQNIGELKTNWENEDKLTDFVRHQNTVSY